MGVPFILITVPRSEPHDLGDNEGLTGPENRKARQIVGRPGGVSLLHAHGH